MDNKHVTWAAISGRWRFSEGGAKFKGEGESASTNGVSFPMGLAISSKQMRSGKCGVKATFAADFGSRDVVEAAGIVVGYRSRDQHYVVAQLGAREGAFVISEFVPGFGWRPLKSGGDRKNLLGATAYTLEAEIAGQEVRFRFEGVPVLDHLLSRPLDGRQVGLLAAGQSEVVFEDFDVQGGRARAFVAMKFSEPYDTFYREVIQKQAQDLDLEVVRIDEVSGPGIIFQDIQKEIERADVVIAEVSPSNLNVFYELGYAHALNKPTILLAQRGSDLPFDIRSYRVIFYNDTIGGKPQVERSLRKHLEAVLAGDEPVAA